MPHSLSSPLERAPSLSEIFDRLAARGNEELLSTPEGAVSSAAVLTRASELRNLWAAAGIGAGSVCAFRGDFGTDTVATFLALASLRAIAVPFTDGTAAEQERLAEQAHVGHVLNPVTGASEARACPSAPHQLVRQLFELDHPGLIVFTSGSSGTPKAILHDMERVASKFIVPRPGHRMVMFLLMDHFGGINTMLSVLANDGVGVCPSDRSVRAICQGISRGRATLLPTTPTFLGLLIASGLWRVADLSSIRLVTYGAEPMPAVVLSRAREILPSAQFKQTYGLSELGVLRTASPDQNSLWLKLGGESFETRVIDGVLHIRSASSMLGYLNAPSPFDADGWMNTGDLVEEHEGMVRFLGRRSEVINVGGQKVLPAEVENVLLEIEGITDAVVEGTAHPVLGHVVTARITVTWPSQRSSALEQVRAHCRTRLQKYKIPMRVEIVPDGTLSTSRAKKKRI